MQITDNSIFEMLLTAYFVIIFISTGISLNCEIYFDYRLCREIFFVHDFKRNIIFKLKYSVPSFPFALF